MNGGGAMRTVLVWVVFSGLFLSGCSNDFALVRVSHGRWHQKEEPWKLEAEPQPPRNPKEEQAVKAAKNRQTIKMPDLTYGYLGYVDDDNLVAVIEENRFSPDLFAPKKVERFLVRSGRIRGSLVTVEPLPDIEFEKAVLNAARGARNESRFNVLLVRNWIKPLTMKASVVGTCTIEVIVIDGFEPYGTVLCEKLVNFCFKEQP